MFYHQSLARHTVVIREVDMKNQSSESFMGIAELSILKTGTYTPRQFDLPFANCTSGILLAEIY